MDSPAQAYPNQDLLVETDWLEEHLEDENLVIVDCELQDSFRRAYRRAHIPGAVSIQTPHWHDPNNLNLVMSLEQFAREMSSLGIGDDTLVITYCCHRSLYATRLWFVLNLYGHDNVKVLNGGWNKWIQEGRPITNKVYSNPPKTFTPRVNESIRRRADYIKESLGNSDVVILDVRRPPAYRGDPSYKWTVPLPEYYVGPYQTKDKDKAPPMVAVTMPFPPTKRQGHIPGAINLPANYVNNYDALEDAVWTFRPADELRQMFQEAGITPDKEIIPHCEHGTRSSQCVFALKLLGYERVRLFDGGWMEWGNREDTPIEN